MQNANRNAPIGVFDSGVGGLTVAREILRQLPEERIVYFGDMARVPYGTKSKETVEKYSKQIARFLLEKEVKAIVVACNTASAFAMEALVQEIPIPVIGVLKPGARTAADATKNKRIGVLGTEGTIQSEMYTEFLRKIDPEITVFGKACPLFVPLVEEGMWNDPITEEMAKRYLKDILKEEVDTLILGCTHYPLLRKLIQKVAGTEVCLVNPAYETAVQLRRVLEWKHLTAEHTGEVSPDAHRFYVSDSPKRFEAFASSILHFGDLHAEEVAIEAY